MKTRNLKLPALMLMAFLTIGSFDRALAKSVDKTMKDFVEDASDAVKHAIDKCKDGAENLQDYLSNYHWKGMIQDKATSGVATLKHLRMNGHSRIVVVKPGEEISCKVKCFLDSEECTAMGIYRVVLGFKGVGAQTTLGGHLGLTAGKSEELFVLTAPKETGIYQLRFKTVKAYLESSALDSWMDEKSNEPDGTTTLGVIVVKS